MGIAPHVNPGITHFSIGHGHDHGHRRFFCHPGLTLGLPYLCLLLQGLEPFKLMKSPQAEAVEMGHQGLGFDTETVRPFRQMFHSQTHPLLVLRHPATGRRLQNGVFLQDTIPKKSTGAGDFRSHAHFKEVISVPGDFQGILHIVVLRSRVADDADSLAVMLMIDHDISLIKGFSLPLDRSDTIDLFTKQCVNFFDGFLMEWMFTLPLIQNGLVGGCREFPLDNLRTLQDAMHGVVITIGDGVKLVVMTTGAPQAQPHEGSAQGVELFVDRVGLLFDGVLFRENLGPNGEKTGPCKRLGFPPRQEISCQLRLQEPVKSHVAVQGLQHPIPIAIRMRIGMVFVSPIGVAIASDIQPVAPPALTIMRRRQQGIHDLYPGVRFSGPLHDFQRLLGGRQAQHIQPYPSKEGLRTCRGSRCQTSGFELIQNEGIDRPSYPRRIDHRWNGRPLGWLPCPMSLIGECPGHPHKTPEHGEEMVATFHG